MSGSQGSNEKLSSIVRSRTTRRQFLLIGAGLLGGAALTACGSGAAQTGSTGAAAASGSAAKASTSKQPATVTYWSPLDHSDTKNPRSKAEIQMCDLFQKAHPEITLKVETVPWQKMSAQLIQAAAAGNGPDVAQLSTKDLSTVVAGQAVLPMDDYVGKDWSTEQRQDWFLPVQNMQFGGKQMAYYWNSLLNNLLYYNKEMLSSKSLTVPKTWDELATTAQALTTSTVSGYVMGFNQDGDAVQLINWLIPALWALGLNVLDDKREIAFNNETGAKPFQWLVDMYYKYKAIPASVAQFTRDNMVDAWASGAAAMTTVGSNTVSTAQAGKDGKQLGLASSPGPANGVMPAFADGKFFVMGRGSKNPEAAGLFMESQLSPEAQIINAKIAGELPSRKSVTKDPFFSSPQGATMKIMLDYMNAFPSKPLQYDAKQAQLQDIIASETQQIIVSRKPIPDALKSMATQWDAAKG